MTVTAQPPAVEFKFWKHELVPQLSEGKVCIAGPILVRGTEAGEQYLQKTREEPYPLPEGFFWSTIDISDEKQLAEMTTLIKENYVEDEGGNCRLTYQPEFIRWHLSHPGSPRDLIVGLRARLSGKLLACVTGVAVRMVLGTDEVVKMAQISFLCIHKRLRTKRLAPVLIKEVTRRVVVRAKTEREYMGAVYTACVKLPGQISQATSWYRNINIKKLVEVGFAYVPPRSTMAMLTRLMRLPERPELGMRPMEPRDADQIQTLLHAKLSKLAMYPVYSSEEISHILLPKPNVVYTYVKENVQGRVTDFVSFNSSEGTLLKYKDTVLRVASAFYHANTTISLTDLFQEALVYSRDLGFDFFSAFDVMDNLDVFDKLKFCAGSEFHYYAYNWRMPPIPPSKVGLITL